MSNNTLKADILEIFSSIQGEGPFMGVKQIFLRFAKCNLSCKFCDLERPFPPKEFSVNKMVSVVKQISANSGEHHSVSLTGGEPLMYNEYLRELLPRLKEMGMKIYLETNATLPERLNDILDLVDIVAADFKLPSSTFGKDHWREHEKFIGLVKNKNCFIKVVITGQTDPADVKKAVKIISRVDSNMLMVLQPVWPRKGVKRAKNKQ
ncbi:MAG: 7-carboxy-7-deazaguanine synthase QueE [Candidatus Omnitrophota bacterium]